MTPEANSQPPGPASDAQGRTVIDPTKNVDTLVAFAVQRLDDLRDASEKRADDLREADARHYREVADIRAQHADVLRKTEAARLDAIRTVDQNQVQRAAEVIADAQETLVAQVAAAAEAMRSTTAAAAVVTATALDAKIMPIQSSVADLQRFQFEATGQRTQVVESRDRGMSIGGWVAIGVSAVAVLSAGAMGMVGLVVSVYLATRP